MSARRIVISGCSGGGKSNIIEALSARGFATMPEAGRIIVREEMAAGGDALPWVNAAAFAAKLVKRAIAQYDLAADGDVFYDRSLIDPVAFMDHHRLAVSSEINAAISQCRYHNQVFVAPPWQEIYINDPERPTSFEDAVKEYEFLIRRYEMQGYTLEDIPKLSVENRVSFILASLDIQ